MACSAKFTSRDKTTFFEDAIVVYLLHLRMREETMELFLESTLIQSGNSNVV